ncbi:FkbM family methyltransferase [Pontibacter sp. H259]|uniref:FkbM family methyltransferase n=1 Tax=Pontibacter sp. H259 TaxID=3133421 RepID=UPI0030BFAEC7
MKQLAKALYHHLPFKKEFFQFLKKLWIPPVSIYQHLHFAGVFQVKIDDTKSLKLKHYGYLIENEIFWTGITGSWEKESLKLWIKLCKHADVILDVGANTGVYSLIAKTVNPEAAVYAFEPINRVFAKLQDNIKLNNFDITAIEKAVSNVDGSAIIYDAPTEHVYSATIYNKTTAKADAVRTKVNTVTLDSFIKEYKLETISLLKIDVERHEPEVLEGFSTYLKFFKPTILIEVLDDEISSKINNLVQGLEYLYFSINEKEGIKRIDLIRKSESFNLLLCTQEIASMLGIVPE